MQLEKTIREELARPEKDILLMTHIVLGYPSLTVNREVIKQMVENGVELIEMQIPFSEPMADGPTIVRANQEAIENGTTVKACMEFAAEMCSEHNTSFLFMTYYNILYKYGMENFFKKAKEIGIKGFIIPDLPPEEGEEFWSLAAQYDIAPILIYAPTSTEERMQELAASAKGFIYCVARKGVTGRQTDFDAAFDDYMARCHRGTALPLAVGFGISNRDDIAYLTGKADIGVIGTATINLVDDKGPEAVGPFIASLR
ncbi:MAG: tryptophan synthase subunit alpha [Thermodesulfobacteriota bacterium]